MLSAPAFAQSIARITLTGSGATSSGGNVTISGSAVTITGPGTYEITGTLNNGYVRVDSPSRRPGDADPQQCHHHQLVQLPTSNRGRGRGRDRPGAGFDQPAHRRLLTSSPTRTSTNPTPPCTAGRPGISGSGSLNIRGNYNDGINSKDDLIISSGTSRSTPSTTASGARTADINGGTIAVRASGDGLKSDDKDADKGIIRITDGTVRVSSGDDAIRAENDVDISGGTITVTESYEGIEAMRSGIRGGTVNVNATDDGINAVEDGLDEFAVAERLGSTSVHGGRQRRRRRRRLQRDSDLLRRYDGHQRPLRRYARRGRDRRQRPGLLQRRHGLRRWTQRWCSSRRRRNGQGWVARN